MFKHKTSMAVFAAMFAAVLSVDSCCPGTKVTEQTSDPLYKYSIQDGYYGSNSLLYTNKITEHVSGAIEFVAQDGKTYNIPYPYYEIKTNTSEHNQGATNGSVSKKTCSDPFERGSRIWEIDFSKESCYSVI
jgi:hypothetical protein